MKIELYYNNYTKTEYTKEEHPLAALYRLIGFENNTLVINLEEFPIINDIFFIR